MGTTVISGCGKAVVVSTGDDTYFGAMAKSLSGTKEATSFEKGVNSIMNLTEELKDKIKKTVEGLNNEGMRVIAVAQKNHVAEDGAFAKEDENDMVLIPP